MSLDTAAGAEVSRRRHERSVWSQAHVVAILVVTEGGDALRSVLEAVEAQVRRPDEIRAVVVGEDRPDVAQILAEHGISTVSTTTRASLRDRVAAALAGLETPGEAEARGHWLWLLRSDTAPAPHALDRQMSAVETAPSVAVAGCKQVQWEDEERLLDVGLSTSRLGAVITGLDRGELDQGQHDARSDVLAVRIGGMLVRHDVWSALDGPDPAVRGARDELEFCRRVHLAGHRVVVVPRAVVATADGARPRFRDDRRDALTLRLAWARWGLLPLALAWSLPAAAVRALVQVVLERPGRAVDELLAPLLVLIRPDRWLRIRRRGRAVRTVPRRALRPLAAAPRALVRQRRDELTSWIRPSVRRVRRPPRPAALLAVLTLTTAASVAAGWRLVATGGALAGPYLSPVPGGAGQLWRSATSSWRPLGLGTAAVGDPLAGLLAVASVPLGADPARLVTVLILGAPILAAVTAYLAVAALSPSRLLRACGALTWAAAAPLLAATRTGRPGPVLVHVLLPLLAWALVRLVRTGAMGSLGAAGLVLTAVLAAAPALALPAIAALVPVAVIGVILGGPRRLPALLAVPVVPAAALLPWWLAVARDPVLLAADPALGWTGPATDVSWWHLAALPEGPDQVFALPAALLARLPELSVAGHDVTRRLPAAIAVAALAPVAVAAAASLLRRRRPALVALAGWWLVLVGLAAALTGERLEVGDGRTWPAPALSLLVGGLLVAAVAGYPALARRLRRRRSLWRRLGWAVLAPFLAAGPVLGLTVFAATAATSSDLPVRRVDASVLPAVAVAEARGPGATRTLALAVDGERVRWTLYRGAGPRLGADSAARRLAITDGIRSDGDVVVPVIAALLSDAGQDTRRQLADLAVGSVLLLPPVDENAEQVLDTAPGLVRFGGGPWAMWRVDSPDGDRAGGRPARVRVVDAEGRTTLVLPTSADRVSVSAEVPAGAAGRHLVLAERADDGWRADYNGVALVPVAPDAPGQASGQASWSQVFELPAQAGRLTVVHTSPASWAGGGWVAGARLAVVLLAGLLALPLPRVRDRIGAPPAPRATRPVERDLAADEVAPRPVPQVFDLDHPEDGELPPVLAQARERDGS